MRLLFATIIFFTVHASYGSASNKTIKYFADSASTAKYSSSSDTSRFHNSLPLAAINVRE